MRTIKGIHKAVSEPIGDLTTYRAMPTHEVPMNMIDPFIFLNHHGWQQYPPHNRGLPFGPHPHRGFETVTFILEGDLMHKGSSGAASTIKEGGVQWMTAGSGIIHAEISSDEFKAKGGPLEILQLWLNLPAKDKMTPPKYVGLSKEQLPVTTWDDGKVTAHILSGKWNDITGPVQPFTDVHLAYVHFKKDGQLALSIPAAKNIFLYVIKGKINTNGSDAQMHDLVIFENDDDDVTIQAKEDAMLLLGHATPFNEPMIAHGPFVMNTREEIMQAYDDFHKGKFGNADLL